MAESLLETQLHFKTFLEIDYGQPIADLIRLANLTFVDPVFRRVTSLPGQDALVIQKKVTVISFDEPIVRRGIGVEFSNSGLTSGGFIELLMLVARPVPIPPPYLIIALGTLLLFGRGAPEVPYIKVKGASRTLSSTLEDRVFPVGSFFLTSD